jgi:hypothetical protein
MKKKSNAITRVRLHQKKKVPRKTFAGPSIRPDERGFLPATPGKSRPVNFDYNLQKNYPKRASQPS